MTLCPKAKLNYLQCICKVEAICLVIGRNTLIYSLVLLWLVGFTVQRELRILGVFVDIRGLGCRVFGWDFR